MASTDTTVERNDLEFKPHQYGLSFDLATQILVSKKLDDRLRLILNVIKTNFGYTNSAIALIDKRTSSLHVCMSKKGLRGQDSIETFDIKLESNSLYVPAAHPSWISPKDDDKQLKFLSWFDCDTSIAAFPLFDNNCLRLNDDLNNKPGKDDEPIECIGGLYVCVNRNDIKDTDIHVLKSFVDFIGAAISSSMEMTRLAGNVDSLKKERQWVESIMKSVADPIVLTDLDNNILLQNRRAEELFSRAKDKEEERDQSLVMNDLIFSNYLTSAAFSNVGIVGRDLTLVDPIEGTDIHFEVVSTPALDEWGERIGLVSVFRDVTDLRRANEELARNFSKLQKAESEARRERDRLDLIIENVGHPVVVCESDGSFILFNRRAEVLFQNQSGNIKRGAAVKSNVDKLTAFICGLSSKPESDRQTEIELIDPESGESLPMDITSGEVLDGKGHVTAVVSILHDLRELRELERRRVEQQLFESEKLAAVGRLAASIAHEVNNPLEAIKNSLYLLQTNKNEAANARFLDIARRETERVSHIIRQMLGFARRSGDVEWVNINQMLEETLVLVEKKLRQTNIKSFAEYDPNLPVIRARADQLRQVFLNLILNAQHAIEDNGEIKVKTARYAQAVLPSISIEVSDTGKGISKEDMTRIFEPFFSTRRKGTGLGLWVTQDIVRHHGGSIEVESVKNKGTTFKIILPVNSPTLNKEDETLDKTINT
jgi:PAS domain S-box-containing protein